MTAPVRKIETFDEYDLVLEEIELCSSKTDPTGAVRAWHTVTPRTKDGGRVRKAPSLARLDQERE
jgi:hypothetical protein